MLMTFVRDHGVQRVATSGSEGGEQPRSLGQHVTDMGRPAKGKRSSALHFLLTIASDIRIILHIVLNQKGYARNEGMTSGDVCCLLSPHYLDIASSQTWPPSSHAEVSLCHRETAEHRREACRPVLQDTVTWAGLPVGEAEHTSAGG